MKFESFFKKNFLMKNYTINDVLSNYDSDKHDKKDGKYSKKEVSIFIEDSIIEFGTFLFGKKRLTEKSFKWMDKNKDNYITTEEIDAYLQEDFNGLKLNDLRNKDIREACAILDKAG